MKYVFFIILFFLIFTPSCNNQNQKIEDIFHKIETEDAKIISAEIVNNNTFNIVLSEVVEILEFSINGEENKEKILGKEFSFPLGRTIEMGEKVTIALTYRKNGGNTTRAYFTLYGKNTRKANLLINEVSVKGTKTLPDRVELLVTKSGNIAGFEITDDLDSTPLTLPSLEVERGDIIVIYWNSKTNKEDYIRENGKHTYFLSGNMANTLISTTGALILFDEHNGTIVDGILYSDFSSSDYGKDKYEKCETLLVENNEWYGEAISSEYVTASRVLTRLKGGVDTNTSEDFFTSQARKSSFGEENEYYPYEED